MKMARSRVHATKFGHPEESLQLVKSESHNKNILSMKRKNFELLGFKPR